MSENQLKEWMAGSRNIVFFGGAGVSTESNIPDFRSQEGIYQSKIDYGYPPEVILSHSFFKRNPERFFDFYRNTMIYEGAQPNPAHLALAKLEREGRLRAVITQNIDGLHQRAGSKEVLELHGSIHRNYCMRCFKSFELERIINSPGVPKCDHCGDTIKPDVVLYEEGLDRDTMRKAVEYISNAEILIVGGTSLAVYPAAGLIDYYQGDKLVLINRSETPYDSRANLVINDSIGRVLEAAVLS